MAVKSKEYKDYTRVELEDKLRQLTEELFNLQFQAKISKLDKPHKIKLIRKDVARLNTFLRALEIKEEVKTKK